MALPPSDITWPPKPWAAQYNKFYEWSAWYSADPERLADVYGGLLTVRDRPSRWKFWERSGRERHEHQSRTQLHVPLASDMASMNASLLFGEAPTFKIPEAHAETAEDGAKETEERLEQILTEGDVRGRLVEAAETASALGGIFLKVDWNKSLIGVPLVSVVQADTAIPEFRFGILVAVTLWRDVEASESGSTVHRHVERHEVGANGNGVVLHGLYKGTKDKLGLRLDLSEHPYTAGFEDVVSLPFPGLGIRYIPNMRPNHLFRGSELGQSDYAGAEGLLDSLDEVWTSWMRDIRLAKARLIVPMEYLEGGKGNGFTFDGDQELFTGLDMQPGDGGGITMSQFDIRVDEHERSANAFMERIVSHAGYSPQTFGLRIEGRAESGTALRIRERQTLSTQQRKRAYWESPLADIGWMLLEVDKAVFTQTLTHFRPQVEMADSLIPDEMETATAVEMLNRAGAVSTEVKVRMAHPSWDEERVQAEVTRIRNEQGLALPDPMQIGQA